MATKKKAKSKKKMTKRKMEGSKADKRSDRKMMGGKKGC